MDALKWMSGREFLVMEVLEPRRLFAVTFNNSFLRTDLVSNGTVGGTNTDLNLVNPRGIAQDPGGGIRVADSGTGVSTRYDGNGVALTPTVAIPVGGTSGGGNPVGVAANNVTGGFLLPTATGNVRAQFIFAGENGTISAWNPASSPNAVLEVDNSGTTAFYKGVAVGQNGFGQPRLYATNFRQGRVDVFNGSFQRVSNGGFVDASIPPGFAPFGIQNVNGRIVVTYARQDSTGTTDVPGVGNGFVDEFDGSGRLIRRIASGGTLNSPWGVARTAGGFGSSRSELLIGNHGDGKINAFDQQSRQFLGQVGISGNPIVVDGLWGLSFGNGLSGQGRNTLFFTAGPNGGDNGVFGRIVFAGGATGANASTAGTGATNQGTTTLPTANQGTTTQPTANQGTTTQPTTNQGTTVNPVSVRLFALPPLPSTTFATPAPGISSSFFGTGGVSATGDVLSTTPSSFTTPVASAIAVPGTTTFPSITTNPGVMNLITTTATTPTTSTSIVGPTTTGSSLSATPTSVFATTSPIGVSTLATGGGAPGGILTGTTTGATGLFSTTPILG